MIGKTLLGLLVVFLVVTIILFVRATYVCEREYDSQLDRAMKASTAQEVRGYLEEAIVGLDNLGLASGNYSFIYKTASSDWSLTVRQLQNLVSKSYGVEAYDIGSMDYAESMQELQGQLARFVGNTEGFKGNHALYAYMAKHYRPIHFFWVFGMPLPYIILVLSMWDHPRRRSVYKNSASGYTKRWVW